MADDISGDMKGPNSPERRRRPRTEIASCAVIQIHNSDDEQLGIVTNVSTTGLAVETAHPPKLGDRVTVRAFLKDDPHGVQADVVRIKAVAEGSYLVGLKYDVLTLEDDPFLLEALRQNIDY